MDNKVLILIIQILVGFGIILALVGIVLKLKSKIEKMFSLKLIWIGVFQILLSSLFFLLQHLSPLQSHIYMAILGFIVATEFFFVGISYIVSLFREFKKKNTRNIILNILMIGVCSVMLDFGMSSFGFILLNHDSTSKNQIGKEFLVFDCETETHHKEKLYMTVNSVKKTKDNDFKITFDLRYQGKDIPLFLDEDDKDLDASSFAGISNFGIYLRPEGWNYDYDDEENYTPSETVCVYFDIDKDKYNSTSQKYENDEVKAFDSLKKYKIYTNPDYKIVSDHFNYVQNYANKYYISNTSIRKIPNTIKSGYVVKNCSVVIKNDFNLDEDDAEIAIFYDELNLENHRNMIDCFTIDLSFY